MPTGCLNKERNVSGGLDPTSSKKELGRVRIATAMYRSGTYEEKIFFYMNLKYVIVICSLLLHMWTHKIKDAPFFDHKR
jgi:hypothetical protein